MIHTTFPQDLHFVGEQLRKHRERAGLSQEQLAEKLDLSTNTIQRFENGVRVPGIDVIMKYADTMNISITELVPSRLSNQPVSVFPIIGDFQKLSPEHKKVVHATMSALIGQLLITQ